MTVAAGIEPRTAFANPMMPTGVGPTGAALPPARPIEQPAGRDTHLLRLSLDLQLDAMLLVLGASAAGRPEDAMPWRRWLDEDVDLAWDLTTTALAVQGALPPALGPDLATADPVTLTEDLLARYTSMCALLEDLLAREGTRRKPAGGDAGPGWHDHVRPALVRYQGRVAELQSHLATLRREGADRLRTGSDEVTRGDTRHAYLPGELLG